jgi:hypothetical protein
MDSVLLRAIHPSREERWPDVGSFTRALRASMDSGSTEGVRLAPERTVSRRVIAVSEPTQAPTPVPLPVRAPVPAQVPAQAPEASRNGSRWLLVLVCLLVLAGTFAASYAVANQLR